nr:zinc finger MYM-type protein 1 [Tanacetum cinerariifolium]
MRPRMRKHASGHSKCLKKRKFEKSKKKEFGSMHRYVKIKSNVASENVNVDTNNSTSDSSTSDSSTDESADNINVENMKADNISYNNDVDDVDDVDAVDDVNVRVNDHDHDDKDEDHDARVNVDHVDIFDLKNWDSLTSHMIKALLAESPKRDKSIEKGPKDENLRRFSSAFYTRILPNNERKGIAKGHLANECFGDWKHLVRYVNVSATCVSVEESFLSFLNVDDTTGQGLFDVTQAELKALDLDNDEFRVTEFSNAVDVAKQIAIEMDIHSLFIQKRVIRRKRQFDEDPVEQDVILSAEESFKINYVFYIIDQAITSLTTRFKQYEEYENIFGFLFTCDKLKTYDDDRLKSCSSRLEVALKNVDQSDINANELYVELRSLNNYLPNENMKPLDVLNFLKQDDCYPNAIIAYRVWLTIPVTVASAERSFSKLKLLESYLRSTMSQARLNGLALIAIENDILVSVNYDDLVNNFTSKNAKRIALFK